MSSGPALVGASMMGDRAAAIFAALDEISGFIAQRMRGNEQPLAGAWNRSLARRCHRSHCGLAQLR